MLYDGSSRLSNDSFTSYGECPPFGFDYEVMFNTEFNNRIYVLQKDNIIIQIKLICNSESLDESELTEFCNSCIAIIAESIKG